MGQVASREMGQEDGILKTVIVRSNKGVWNQMRTGGTAMLKGSIAAAVLLLVFSYAYADEKRYVVPLDDSPSCGPPNAAVTIIEFLDYQ